MGQLRVSGAGQVTPLFKDGTVTVACRFCFPVCGLQVDHASHELTQSTPQFLV